MLDQGLTTGHQRTAGRAEAARSLRSGRTRLDRLHRSGAAKGMLTRVHAADPEVMFLNTAGGPTGGDHLRYGVGIGPGARAVATLRASAPDAMPLCRYLVACWNGCAAMRRRASGSRDLMKETQ